MGVEKLRDEEWVAEKASEHLDQEIADMVGCTRNNVHYWRNKHGIAPYAESRYDKIYDDEWLEEKLENHNQTQIAEMVGCSQALVSIRVSEL